MGIKILCVFNRLNSVFCKYKIKVKGDGYIFENVYLKS